MPLSEESEALVRDIRYPSLKHGSNELRARLTAIEAAARADAYEEAAKLVPDSVSLTEAYNMGRADAERSLVDLLRGWIMATEDEWGGIHDEDCMQQAVEDRCLMHRTEAALAATTGSAVSVTATGAEGWTGPGEYGHRYSPDHQAMGDCRKCGHVFEAHREAHRTPPATPPASDGAVERCGSCEHAPDEHADIGVRGCLVIEPDEWGVSRICPCHIFQPIPAPDASVEP